MRERAAALLALIEGLSIFIAVCGLAFVWARPRAAGDFGFFDVLGPAGISWICCQTVFYYNGLYDLRTVRRFIEYTAKLPQSLCAGLILLGIISAGFPALMPGEHVWVKAMATFVAVGIISLPIRALFYRAIRSTRLFRRTVVLGLNPFAEQLIREITDQSHAGYNLVGIVRDSEEACTALPVASACVVAFEQLERFVAETRPDRIIAALGDRRKLPVRQLMKFQLRGIVVEDGIELYERLTGKVSIESLTPMRLLFSRDFKKSALQMNLRRGLNFAAALAALLFSAPLMVLIAAAIKLDSKGPILFIHDRVGLGGRAFRLLKFRTMRHDIQAASEWAGDNGDRITRIGKWLRMFRLDELPQFVNILRGDMDLVGPRPHPVSNHLLLVIVLRNAPECGEAIPYSVLRCSVRPGITGWAQVRYGYADNLEEEIEKVKYDLYYIKHMSLWFDFRILLDTVKVALMGRVEGLSPLSRNKAPLQMRMR